MLVRIYNVRRFESAKGFRSYWIHPCFVYVIYVLLLLCVKTLDGVDILRLPRLCPAPQSLFSIFRKLKKGSIEASME